MLTSISIPGTSPDGHPVVSRAPAAPQGMRAPGAPAAPAAPIVPGGAGAQDVPVVPGGTGAAGAGRGLGVAGTRAPPMLRKASAQDVGSPCGQGKLARQDSSRSNHSENSFQTASSDPQINFIPRQISESYQMAAPESAAHERKSSVRALQQAQYSALLAPGQPTGPNGAQQTKQGARTQNKSVR